MHWRPGARIAPLMNFGMPVHEGDSTRSIVVTCWEIDDFDCAIVSRFDHLVGKPAGIDSVRMLVQQAIDSRRRRNVAKSFENFILWVGQPDTRTTGRSAIAIEGLTHAHAPHARCEHAFDQ